MPGALRSGPTTSLEELRIANVPALSGKLVFNGWRTLCYNDDMTLLRDYQHEYPSMTDDCSTCFQCSDRATLEQKSRMLHLSKVSTLDSKRSSIDPRVTPDFAYTSVLV